MQYNTKLQCFPTQYMLSFKLGIISQSDSEWQWCRINSKWIPDKQAKMCSTTRSRWTPPGDLPGSCYVSWGSCRVSIRVSVVIRPWSQPTGHWLGEI